MSWVELWNDIEAHYFTSSFGEYFGTLPVPLKSAARNYLNTK